MTTTQSGPLNTDTRPEHAELWRDPSMPYWLRIAFLATHPRFNNEELAPGEIRFHLRDSRFEKPSPRDVDVAIKQCIRMGLLTEDSTARRLTIPGGAA